METKIKLNLTWTFTLWKPGSNMRRKGSLLIQKRYQIWAYPFWIKVIRKAGSKSLIRNGIKYFCQMILNRIKIMIFKRGGVQWPTAQFSTSNLSTFLNASPHGWYTTTKPMTRTFWKWLSFQSGCHGNRARPLIGRNSKTNFRSTFKIGRVVHKNNAHKTMKPDFWCGCHGNQEAANQGILWRSLKFEKKI